MRIRQTKPEFWKHVGLGEISDLARLLFIGLWSMADCAGRLKDQAKLIKAELFTYSTQVDVDAIESMLTELASHEEEFIVRYEVDGKRYIQVSNFKSHQHLMGNEAKATSKYPVPTSKNKYVPILTEITEPKGETQESNDSKEYVPVRTNVYPVPISTTDIRSNGITGNGISLSDSPESNDNKNSSEEPKEFIELAEWFFDEIRKNNPTHKQPKFNSWAKDIRLIIQTDKRTTAEFKELFTWVQKDGFWRANCLSPSKLREKWDQLWMKMKSPPKQPYQIHSTALPGNQITPAHLRQSGVIDIS